MAKATKASKTATSKSKPAIKAAKTIKEKPAQKSTAKKPVKKAAGKASVSKAKPQGSRRRLDDAKIAKMQKMYKSNKYSAQQLCDEFGISMATLFNYLKVEL